MVNTETCMSCLNVVKTFLSIKLEKKHFKCFSLHENLS